MFKSCSLVCMGLLACLFASFASAQSEAAVAYVRPMKAVDVDGSFDDWPADMVRHPLLTTFRVYGPTDIDLVDLTDNNDLQADFMIGWNATTNLIYVAVTVRDDVLAGADVRSEFTDGIELYLGTEPFEDVGEPMDGARMAPQRFGYQVPQYNYVPGLGSYSSQSNPGVVGLPQQRLRTRAAHTRGEGITRYEWAVEAFTGMDVQKPVEFQPGLRLAFDVTIVDRDHDKDPTAFVSWGPVGGYKYLNRQKVGTIVLLGDDTPMGRVEGAMIEPGAGGQPVAGKVVEFIDANNRPAGVARTDRNGKFAIALPPGTYTARAAKWQALRTDAAMKVEVAADKVVSLQLPAGRVELPDILIKSVAAYDGARTYSDQTSMVIEARNHGEIAAGGATWTLDFESPNRLRIESKARAMSGMLLVSNGEKFSLHTKTNVNANGQPMPVMGNAPQSVFQLNAGDVPAVLTEIGVRRMVAVTGHYSGALIPMQAQSSLRYPTGQMQTGTVGFTFQAGALATMPYAHRLLWSESPMAELQFGLADARLVGKDTLSGEPVSIVELDKRASTVLGGLNPCGPGSGQLVTLKLWISERDFLIRKAEWAIDLDVLLEDIRAQNKGTNMVRYVETHDVVRQDAAIPVETFDLDAIGAARPPADGRIINLR